MLPPRSRDAMMEATLPEDPEPNQICRMPEGHVAGASHVLHIFQAGVAIGTAEELMRIPNVAGKATLTRPWTSKKLKEGDTLDLQFTRYDIKAVKYIDYFGWQAHEFLETPEIQDMGRWEVVSLVPVGPQKENVNVYAILCLSKITEIEK